MRTKNSRGSILLVILIIIICFSHVPITSSQHSPLAVAGYVVDRGGTPVPDGTVVTVTNENTGISTTTTTGLGTGLYATTILASNGDIINASAAVGTQTGRNSTFADFALVTNWINITLGNQPPVACFTYTPQYPFTDETVTFNDCSTDSGGTIISWDWEYGDGDGYSRRDANHVYDEPGSYRVKLTVTDNDGQTDTARDYIYIGQDTPHIPPPQPPKVRGYTVPEMYSLLRVSDLTDSSSSLTIVFMDSGVLSQTYKGIDLSNIEMLYHPSYTNGLDTYGHGCVSGDSYLYLEHGLIKIKDFYENSDAETVETTIGMTKYINTKTMSVSEEGMTQIDDIYATHKVKVDEAIEITTLWNKTLLLTPWHPTPTVTSSGIVWKRADEITCDDYIASPIKTEDFGEYQDIEYFKRDNQNQSKKHTILLDEDLAWLIGFTIGDGTVYPATNQVMLHDEKLSTLRKAKEIVEKRGFSVGKGIRTIKGQNSHILNIYYGFDKFFVAMGYDNAIKNIPDVIFKSPSSVRASFVAGLFDAEGYCWENSKGKRQRYGLGEIRVIVSTNEELCKGVVVILDSLGLPSSYEVTLKEGYSGMKNNHTLYAVTLKQKWNLINFLAKSGEYIVTFKKDVIERNIASNQGNKRLVVFFGDYVGLKIRKIESKKDTAEYFYDLSTKKNNNYYASGFMVHNTFVAYELAYITQTKLPNARLISYRVFDGRGKTTPDVFLTSIDNVKELKPDIVSISGGARGNPDDRYSKAIEELRKSGVIVICAAGNNGPRSGTILSPACSDSAIAVGASDPQWAENYTERWRIILDLSDDIICSWSSRGPVVGLLKPDVASPGESIIGPWLGTGTVKSGTSMSTPLIAGGAALVLSNNKLLVDMVNTLYFWDGAIIPKAFESALKEGCQQPDAYSTDGEDAWGTGIPVFTDVNSIFFWKLVALLLIPLILVGIAVAVAVVWWYLKRREKARHKVQ